MIKPKTQNFRVKVMLIKLEAVNNRVSTRCHASLVIDGNEQYFKATPELKKNIALFNSEVEFQHFSIQLDEVTGLYEQKMASLQLQIETQGTRMKMGDVTINLGGVLNEKKYRMVNQYPLSKCYDKTAKVRLSVDFIPIGSTESYSERKEKREMKSINPSEVELISPFSAGREKRSGPLKSRLAEESNVILQERIFEYEQKMENYRLSQTQLQQKLHEQIGNKDDKISDLTLDLNRRNQQLSGANLEIEQLRFKIKEQDQQLASFKQQKRNLVLMIQNHEKTQDSLKQELATVKASLENIIRTKQNKQKYYNQQISKYTAKYLESEQERNKIIFQLETKFKEQIEKKEHNYRSILSSTQKKYEELCKNIKEKVKTQENQLANKEEEFQEALRKNVKYHELLDLREKQVGRLKVQNEELSQNLNIIKQQNGELSSELQTLNFSYNELELDVQKHKEENALLRRNNQQLKMELMMANQTIDEQHKSITKYNKELQVHQERQYFLTQKYNDELEIKSINEDNIRGETMYYQQEIHILKNKLNIAQDRADDESSRANQLAQTIQRLQNELSQRSQSIMRLSQEKIAIENEVKNIRNELSDMEEAVLILKEQNMQLNDMLNDKKEALENDRSIEWSYKIEELQNDIAQMVEKFRIEKESMRQTFRREENKKKQELSKLESMLKKAKDEAEQMKRNNLKKQAAIREYEKNIEGVKNQFKTKVKQLGELNQRLRQETLEKEQIQKKLKTNNDSYETRIREVESKIAKETHNGKKLQLNKTGLQKIIQGLLQIMGRPLQTVVSFQEIFASDVDIEFINLVNLSVKKHCDERTKMREHIKKMQAEIEMQATQTTNYKQLQSETLTFKERVTKVDRVESQTKIYQSQVEGWRQQYKPGSYQLDEVRDENSRLKRQISELKMKMRNMEEEVSKAERNTDAERHEKNQIKRQLQEAQDEVDKLSFQLKRKEKQIIQYENEIKQIQVSTIPQTNIQVSKPKVNLSRVQLRQKEKQQSLNNNRKDILIRELESRLEGKTREVEEMLSEMSKLRSDNTAKKQAMIHLTNECKFLEGKAKERNAKFASQEILFMETKNRLEDELNRMLLQHKQQIQSIAQQLMQAQEEIIQHKKTIDQLTHKLQQSERKLKSLKEDGRMSQYKSKKQHQLMITQLKDTINELEGFLAKVQSQKQQLQLRIKQQAVRSGSQSNMLTKRSQQIQRLVNEVRVKQQEIFQLEQDAEVAKSQHEARILEMQEYIEQLESTCQKKEYELEECKFVSQGTILDLERQIEELQEKA